MPSLTTWTRLEPFARNVDLTGGLRAAVGDPLWLLARQWQVGEFVGQDGGSPVHARAQIDCTPPTRHLPGGVPTAWFRDGALTRGVPLEAQLERERVRIDTAWQPRLAAEAGLQFWRVLDAFGAGAQRAAVLARFPLAAPAGPTASADVETRRFLSVVAGRVPDGTLLGGVLVAARDGTPPAALPPAVALGLQQWQSFLQTLAAAERTRVAAAVMAWLAWYGAAAGPPAPLFCEPAEAENPSWIADRLDYGALVAAPTPAGEVVLAAPEFSGDALDWYAFDVVPAVSLGAAHDDLTDPEKSAERRMPSAVPTPVGYPGMPRPRWWEFEDARADFGAVAAGTQQLVHLLLIEFALVYGHDWFVVPVMAPVGTLCRTNWLVVRDSFGDQTLVSSARAADATFAIGGRRPFDLFALSSGRGLDGMAPAVEDLLFLPPNLATSLSGAPIEDVVFLRDQMANMAWAVERIVESPLGRPLDRAQADLRGRQDGAAGPPPAASAPPLYRLIDGLPDHWVPLLPMRLAAGAASIGLVRAAPWQGRILAPGLDANHQPVPIREEEVPREGARVTRVFRHARWTGGETYLWVARRKGPGRGEGSSGVRFDALVPASQAP